MTQGVVCGSGSGEASHPSAAGEGTPASASQGADRTPEGVTCLEGHCGWPWGRGPARAGAGWQWRGECSGTRGWLDRDPEKWTLHWQHCQRTLEREQCPVSFQRKKVQNDSHLRGNVLFYLAMHHWLHKTSQLSFGGWHHDYTTETKTAVRCKSFNGTDKTVPTETLQKISDFLCC